MTTIMAVESKKFLLVYIHSKTFEKRFYSCLDQKLNKLNSDGASVVPVGAVLLAAGATGEP